MDLPALLTFWAAFALALVSPGPNFALMLRIGLGSGRVTALRTTLGIAVGEAVWGFAAVFGVAALALRYPGAGHGHPIGRRLLPAVAGVGRVALGLAAAEMPRPARCRRPAGSGPVSP